MAIHQCQIAYWLAQMISWLLPDAGHVGHYLAHCLKFVLARFERADLPAIALLCHRIAYGSISHDRIAVVLAL